MLQLDSSVLAVGWHRNCNGTPLCLQALMYKNSSHQVILPTDSLGESSKAHLCRTYCMVAAASPLYSSSASRGQGVLSTKELFKVMLSNVRCNQYPPAGMFCSIQCPLL